MIVTIIGSRQTPLHILAIMQVLSKYFYKSGWILRSGGADGADTAGATHYPVNDPLREIYVPWKNFNNVEDGIHDGDVDDAEVIASCVHPAWHRCKIGAKKLHSRNVFQILGKHPVSAMVLSDLVVCWTPHGADVGGTATAVELAHRHNVPTFNFGQLNTPESIEDGLKCLDMFLDWLKETLNITLDM